MKKFLAMSGLLVALISASAPVFALGALGDRLRNLDRPGRPNVSAPEIDVTAGTKGIAVLIAGLLLAAEAMRRRR
jgi:hypothetical protein